MLILFLSSLHSKIKILFPPEVKGKKKLTCSVFCTIQYIAIKLMFFYTAAAAKSHQSCPTLCDPTDRSPPGSPVPGILQARTLEWVAISFSNAWKRKVKGSRSVSDPLRPHGLQPTRLLRPWDFPGKSTRVGCHCLLCLLHYLTLIILLNLSWLHANFSTFPFCIESP